MVSPEPRWVSEVLEFWLQETAPERRFKRDDALDREITRRFGGLHEKLAADLPKAASLNPRLALAALIVLDQFPRNMFRGTARAFASDATALAVARTAVQGGLDKELTPDERLFVYLPLEHSEDMADQERAVALIASLGNAEWDRHAIADRDVIARFGRFPHRNAVLARTSTPEEIAFLKEPGSSF